MCGICFFFFFFFNDTATTEIYTLSLHDALPISSKPSPQPPRSSRRWHAPSATSRVPRSEEHTSELQSLRHLVCRLLLEKKKKKTKGKCVEFKLCQHTLALCLIKWFIVSRDGMDG